MNKKFNAYYLNKKYYDFINKKNKEQLWKLIEK